MASVAVPHRRSILGGRKSVFAVHTKTDGPPCIQGEDSLTTLQRTTLGIVAQTPGTTIQQVGTKLCVTHSTATYHLLALARLGFIEQLRDGRELRHFTLPRGSSRKSYVLALLRDSRTGPLVRFLTTSPIAQMTINQVATATNLPFGFVRRTLVKLEDMHLVSMARGSYRYAIHVHSDLHALV